MCAWAKEPDEKTNNDAGSQPLFRFPEDSKMKALLSTATMRENRYKPADSLVALACATRVFTCTAAYVAPWPNG